MVCTDVCFPIRTLCNDKEHYALLKDGTGAITDSPWKPRLALALLNSLQRFHEGAQSPGTCMASRRIDIELHRLAKDEVIASQLRTGQPVSLVEREDSPELQVQDAEGLLIGVIAEPSNKQQLLTGTAVIRSLRKQQGLLVHILIRVTFSDTNTAPQQGTVSS